MATDVVSEQPLQAEASPAVTSENGAPAKQGAVTGNTHISSLKDLKEKAPKVWQMMMQGIGMTICKQMEKGQARIKDAMRKARQDANGG